MEWELELRKYESAESFVVSPEHLTLDSDGGVVRYLSSERGSTGVESSLRC